MLQEWDILYDELRIKSVLGKGRYATVYRGFWHGDIAIKVLNTRYSPQDEKILKKFKFEVRICNYIDYIKIVNKRYFIIK